MCFGSIVHLDFVWNFQITKATLFSALKMLHRYVLDGLCSLTSHGDSVWSEWNWLSKFKLFISWLNCSPPPPRKSYRCSSSIINFITVQIWRIADMVVFARIAFFRSPKQTPDTLLLFPIQLGFFFRCLFMRLLQPLFWHTQKLQTLKNEFKNENSHHRIPNTSNQF